MSNQQFGRQLGSSPNAIIATLNGTTNNAVALKPGIFSGAECNGGSGAFTVYNGTSSTGVQVMSRTLTTGGEYVPNGGPVLCPAGIYITQGATTMVTAVLGHLST